MCALVFSQVQSSIVARFRNVPNARSRDFALQMRRTSSFCSSLLNLDTHNRFVKRPCSNGATLLFFKVRCRRKGRFAAPRFMPAMEITLWVGAVSPATLERKYSLARPKEQSLPYRVEGHRRSDCLDILALDNGWALSISIDLGLEMPCKVESLTRSFRE